MKVEEKLDKLIADVSEIKGMLNTLVSDKKEVRKCKYCGNLFVKDGKKQYCENCRNDAKVWAKIRYANRMTDEKQKLLLNIRSLVRDDLYAKETFEKEYKRKRYGDFTKEEITDWLRTYHEKLLKERKERREQNG